MNDQPNDDFPPQYRQEKQGKGCLFWGCLITVLLFFALLIGTALAAYFGIRGFVRQWTAEEPMEIEVVELPEEEMNALNTRYEAFEQAVKAGENPGDLELTAREINALIGQDETLSGRVVVRIEDGQLGGDVSIPTDFIPMVGKGRFFNASAEFDASMDGGVLVVTLADATVNGAQVPAEVIEGLKSENLAKDLYNNAETAKVLRQFESLTIEGDKVILKARPASEAAQSDAAQSDAAQPDSAEPAGDPADPAPAEAPPAEPETAA